MPNHSPGPWYVEELNPDELEITTGEGGRRLAIVDCDGNKKKVDGYVPSKEAHANAKLMAAAPELLKECKNALALLESADAEAFGLSDYGLSLHLKTLEAIIAKAEGKEHHGK